MMTRYILILTTSAIIYWGCSGGNDKNKIEASGTIEATDVIVSSKTQGEILELRTDEGSEVKAGDTLLVIDHEVLEIQLKQAVAGKDFAQAQYTLLRQGARKEDINSAQEQLKQAEVNLNQAETDRKRMEQLFNSKSITKKQYEDADSRYEITRAQYSAAEENFNKLKNLARPEELKQMQANLNKSEAAIDLLKKNIRDSYVISPINGIVVKKFVEKGETVNPSASLFKVSDLKEVKLVIYVSEEELGKVKLGNDVQITVDSYKDKIFKGKVSYISPEAEFTPKNIQTKDERTKLVFAVKINIPNPDFELKAGMPADAAIQL